MIVSPVLFVSALLIGACSSPSEYYGEPGGPGPSPQVPNDPAGDPPAEGGGDGMLLAGEDDLGDSEWSDLHCFPTSLALEKTGLKRGEGVIVSGVIESEVTTEGRTTMIDVITEPDAGGIVRNVMNVSCHAIGAFSLELPKDLGPVRLVAFASSPEQSARESPAGLTEQPVIIGDEPVEGVKIVLRAEPELGDYTPWLALPPGEDPSKSESLPPPVEEEPELEAGEPAPLEGVEAAEEAAPEAAEPSP